MGGGGSSDWVGLWESWRRGGSKPPVLRFDGGCGEG